MKKETHPLAILLTIYPEMKPVFSSHPLQSKKLELLGATKPGLPHWVLQDLKTHVKI